MEVVQEAAAAADHGQEAAAGGEILHRLLEVGGQVVDAIGQDGNLDVRGAGVLLVQAVTCNDLTFRRRSHKVIDHRMTKSRGVNDFSVVEGGRSRVEGGRWKVERVVNVKVLRERLGARIRLTPSAIFHLPSSVRRVMGALVFVVLGMVNGSAAQETGWKEDLTRMGLEVPIEELEKGEIVGQKWMVQGAGPGFLGARAFFIAPAKPSEVAQKVLEFDPTRGKTLEWSAEGSVKLYEPFSRPPTAENWARFREALGKAPFEILLQVEGRKEGRIHLHPEEIKKVAEGKVDGWVQVLEERIRVYHRGGWKENAGVPAGPDSLIDFDENLREVMKANGPVRDEFRRVLTALAYGGQDKKEPVEVQDYWQLMEVDKSPAVALGCAVMKEGGGGRYEVADMHYFVSNGYFGAVSLYGIWPYGEGRSLVCRIDAVETDPYQLSQATARMIGEGLFMREVKAGCQTILDKIKGS